MLERKILALKKATYGCLENKNQIYFFELFFNSLVFVKDFPKLQAGLSRHEVHLLNLLVLF